MKSTKMFCSLALLIMSILPSCGNRQSDEDTLLVLPPADAVNAAIFNFKIDDEGIPMKVVYSEATSKDSCFFVVSKVHPEHLNVYESVKGDTVLLASYPVCIAKNKGQKEKRGDNKTPESYPGEPFYIQQIQDASSWKHDFGDGRGSIPAYGHWFLRLYTPGHSGIGIHGSTGNRESILKGRGSEGCIRLLDEDIIHLHDHYAVKGTKVIILPEEMEVLQFEIRSLTARLTDEPIPVVKDKDSLKPAPSEPAKAEINTEAAKTWPDQVKVKNHMVRLVGDDGSAGLIYKDDNGNTVRPKDGDVLKCIGETGKYYKVVFDGREVFINKEQSIYR